MLMRAPYESGPPRRRCAIRVAIGNKKGAPSAQAPSWRGTAPAPSRVAAYLPAFFRPLAGAKPHGRAQSPSRGAADRPPAPHRARTAPAPRPYPHCTAPASLTHRATAALAPCLRCSRAAFAPAPTRAAQHPHCTASSSTTHPYWSINCETQLAPLKNQIDGFTV